MAEVSKVEAEKGKGSGPADRTCWNCGESGHMKRQCPKKSKKGRVNVVEGEEAGDQGNEPHQ